MEQYRKEIERVWNETLTAEEKKQLLATFLEEEARWKVLLEEAYWQDIQTGMQYLPEVRSASLLAQLHGQILDTHTTARPEAKGRVRRLHAGFKWAIAAAVTVLFFTGYYHFQQRSSSSIPTIPVVQAPVPVLQLQRNAGQMDRTIQLGDGSLVTLGPGSSIRYYEPFVHNRRDISLAGQAWFTVAKDTLRPFTVYAHDIATTALGTQFMISTLVKDKVQVRLFEGKVVVRSAGKQLVMKDVFLKPGEEFDVDQLLRQFTVKRFTDVGGKKGTVIVGQAPAAEKIIAPGLEFTQESLKVVLSAIEKRYKVHFTYQEDAIGNEEVTGKFLASDSLQTVLSILGSVNRLSFTTQNGVITVSKLK